MEEREALSFARNVARQLWRDDEAESAAGQAVLQFMQMEIDGNPYSLLKTITIRRVTDALRKKYGRRPAEQRWPTVAAEVGQTPSEEEMQRSRELCHDIPFDARRPKMFSALIGESLTVEDTMDDAEAEEAIDSVISSVSAGAEVQAVMKKLTPREQEIFTLLASGLTLKETGERLGVTESRVCQIRSRARSRIGA
ncbi:MAG: sigma-70 family RNA polymerase sigma factor [Actinobacteria bacterium]|nr:sigma-70 family RNA polymerase sigma factor [Actinomycetota bacterium]